MRPSIRQRISRLHLWIGEALGLTKYRNCWHCKHCREFDADTKGIVLCDLDFEEDGVCAITDPSEAVWCLDWFEEKDEC